MRKSKILPIVFIAIGAAMAITGFVGSGENHGYDSFEAMAMACPGIGIAISGFSEYFKIKMKEI